MNENKSVRIVGLNDAPPGMARVWAEAPSPSYIVDGARLIRNLEILARVKRETGCRILLAQKAFTMFYFYPLIRVYLDGSTASGLFEARLGKEEMGGETHVFSAAYREDEFDELLRYADHVVFNSFAQWRQFGKKALSAGAACGLPHATAATRATAGAMNKPLMSMNYLKSS